MKERPINERFLSIEKKMNSAKTLLDLGKANELNFFIFDYDPKEELLVREETKKLKRMNPNIQEFDLFDIVVNLLKDAGYLETAEQYELDPEYTSDLLLSQRFQPFLALSEDDSPVLNVFKSEVKDDGEHIVLITGVGKAYPLIRSHTVLNRLQSIVMNDPVVMFYPGRYDQKSAMCLKLFDRLGDDNYYRAFPLEERFSEKGGNGCVD